MKWLGFVAVFVSGGLIGKFFEFIYQEYRRRSDTRKTSRNLVDKHIEPIIKAADPFAIDWLDERVPYDEDRYAVIAYTLRGDTIRIISARGAEAYEKRRYHEENAT
jgi:uncharacterized DUF497 family protein